MPFLDRLQEDLGKRYPKAINPAKGPQPPGNFSFGTQVQGGPHYTDAFKAQRAPSLAGLVENYSALIYAMVARNRNAVARVPMRLMGDESRADANGKQRKFGRACDPIRVSRSIGRRLARDGKVSTAAVDQISEIRNHPLLDLIDEPDPYGSFTREKLIGLLVSYMDVIGSAYLVPEGNGWDWQKENAKPDGPPQNLWVLYPQYVIPVRLSASPIVSTFTYFSSRLPYQSVLWFRHNHSLKDAYGSAFSPTYAGESYRKQEQELVAILSQVLGIGPRPNLLATAKDANMGITPTQKENFEKDLVRKHAAYGAGGVLVNDGSWDITPIEYPKADIAARDIAQHDRDNLASIFDQPPTYYTVDSNLANLEAADAQFAKNAVEPRCKTIAAQFTRIAKMFDERLFFAHDPVTQEDDEAREKVFTMMLTSGRATINQVNEEEKWEKAPWGDAPWLPGTLKQPDMITAEHEMGLETGKAALESQGTQDELAVDGQEHQKKMDKEGLKIENKKASQKPEAPAKRSLDERLEAAIELIESQIASLTSAV